MLRCIYESILLNWCFRVLRIDSQRWPEEKGDMRVGQRWEEQGKRGHRNNVNNKNDIKKIAVAVDCIIFYSILWKRI